MTMTARIMTKPSARAKSEFLLSLLKNESNYILRFLRR
jgi:hypothetical protein